MTTLALTPKQAFDLARRYGDAVPVDVFALAGEMGLGPISEALPENISGLIRRNEDGSMSVVYNFWHARTRQRFTVAHEIGHFIFHRDRLDAGVSDTLAFRADDVELPNPRIGREQEWQANNFAANLLVPDRWLRAARASGINDVKELARQFEVSPAVMKIKLGLPRD
jgi:Zn-dependent peptidase ImmA (M78 family)